MGVASESGTRSGPCLGPSISELAAAFRSGETTPADICRQVLAAISERGDDGVWISVADDEAVLARCAGLAEVDDPSALPLWGIPFGVKDSIDIAGWPTTLACPGYAYVATETAPVVQRLLDAGAVLIGKTNLDQFATGLNGTRTPYPTPHSVYGQDLISGGSSSGSALAVALGEVPFTVATDTAGSGRVPPALNGILGYKPSRGLISAVGLVPACRSLDCISLIAGTVSDLEIVLDVVAGVDDADPWSRQRVRRDETAADLVVGLPAFDDLEFFGDAAMSTAQRAARERLSGLLATRSVDLDPFLAAGELLYQGPWVAERYVEFGDFLRDNPEAALPVVADIINGGERFSAGRRVPGPVPAGRAQGRRRSSVRRRRRRRAADDRHHLHHRGGAGGADRDQHHARPLHPLRQPARSVCRRRARRPDRRRSAGELHGPRTGPRPTTSS